MDPPADGEEGQAESKEQDEDEQEENHAKGEPGQKQVDAAGGQCVDGVWFPPGWKVDEGEGSWEASWPQLQALHLP